MSNLPALSSFGVGRLYGFRTDIAGATPLPFGVLQGVDWDFSHTTKGLIGTNQIPIFIARGEGKYTGKAKSGTLSGLLVNNIFFGQSLTGGQLALQTDELHTVPPSSGFTISVSPPNSGTFQQDFGAAYAPPNSVSPGFPLTYETASPGQGQYEQSNGLYTFNSLDAGGLVNLSYLYLYGGAGQRIVLSNQPMGTTPFFSGVFRNRDPRSGLYNTLVINRMTSSKLSLSSKTGDYSIPEFDFEVMDDGTGNIGTMSFGDVS